ncbi:MAG: DUF2188 domain-containing protein [bacterium]|nr:DUF2188 domain-containing protein [bacterium]
MGKNVHVVPQNNQWAVKQEGSKAPVSTHRTQHAAEDAGRNLARHNQSELITHRPNGQIRSKDSFGPDPNPPKDKEH